MIASSQKTTPFSAMAINFGLTNYRSNESLSGKKLSVRDMVLGRAVAAPASAEKLLSTLNQHSPKELVEK
jgi:hypothetical protein